MVSSAGGCGCFLGAAGGCGCWGCGRGSLGLPRSRCRSAPSGVGLRFRRVLRKRRAQTTTAPTVRRLPGPGAPRMRRFYISARARRNRFRGDSCVLVSYVTLAYSAWSRVFADYAKPGAVPLLFVIKQLLCCARRTCIQSLLETAQYTAKEQRPILGALRNNGLRRQPA